MENYQTSNILFLEFSHSEVSQLYLPINAIFPMLVAVYLQTPDKRFLKIQYFFNFKCRVPMFEDPEAPYTLETRFLGADLIEVFKILRGFENLHSERFFQVIGESARRGTVSKLFKKRYVIIVWTWGSSSLLAWFVRSTHLNIIIVSNLTDFSWILLHYIHGLRRTNSGKRLKLTI